MKVAILSLTSDGLNLSKKIKSFLDMDSTIIKTDIFYKNFKKNIEICFYEYDAIITIAASGIVVRSISKLIESKIKDPAIINIDENGKFVISLLSGHIGGANQFTKKIARYLNAEEIITTSTDNNNKVAIDTISNKFYLYINNPKEILHFNKAIIEGKKIELYFNEKSNFNYLINFIQNNTLETYLLKFDNNISKNEILAKIDNHKLIIRERNLVVGIGCKKGKTQQEILKALKISLKELNLPISRVNFIATGQMKKNEKGILDLSEYLQKPLKVVKKEKLELFYFKDSSYSEFVYSKFGIGGLCESSAMIVAGFDSKLIYKKTAFDGVTIAFAISK